jgi:hypothetical protein
MIDLAGQLFGRLTVVSRAGTAGGEVLWACKCECGGRKNVRGYCLRKGLTRSCGCLQKEATALAKTTHGQRRSREYRIWSAMKDRCTNENCHAFADYGARGIGVCDRWMDFGVFLEDMGKAPPRASIERIDNALGYEPGNCRWATAAEQARNKRNNVVLEHQGRSMCLSDWARELGVSRGCLRGRLRRGKSVHEVLREASYVAVESRPTS